MKKIDIKNLLRNPYALALRFSSPKQAVYFELERYIASSLETKIGNLVEAIAIACRPENEKSCYRGVDIEMESNGKKYIVSVKSGKNWANSSSAKAQRHDFLYAINDIRRKQRIIEVVPVMGICSGNSKATYRQKHTCGGPCLYGQDFWYFISGKREFYKDIANEISIGADAFQNNLNEFMMSAYSRLITDNFSVKDQELTWDELTILKCRNIDDKDASPMARSQNVFC